MASETISGVFQAVKWSKDDGSWIIAHLEDKTCVVGAANSEMFIQGIEYIFSGSWVNHPSFGRQFKFTNYLAKPPVTESAVMSYLQKYLFGSGAGIGPVGARKLIAEVGPEKTLSTIKSSIDVVMRITGVEQSKAELASVIMIEQEKFEDVRMQLAVLFQGRGFSQKLVDDAIADFGVRAAERIRRDPFTLLVRRYSSAGFARCDQLYQDLGLPEDRLKRQTICLWHQITQADGSIWIDADLAVQELRRMVNAKINPKKAIKLGLRAKWLASYRDKNNKLWLSERQDAIYERSIAKTIMNFIEPEDG